ncbi:MAG: hypothetical protein EXQ71_06230 [Acidimicrobiia bacterium]|nr:hypothetical protein [Acidimicrobiia bacterium]
MDPTYPPEATVYREKVQAFLAEHLPTTWQGIGALPSREVEPFPKAWRATLYQRGHKGGFISWVFSGEDIWGQTAVLSSATAAAVEELFAFAGRYQCSRWQVRFPMSG